MGAECCGIDFSGERGYNELQGIYCRGVKLLEHAMKVVEKMLERRLKRVVKKDKMQVDFMLGKGMIDAVFILRLQEEYLDKEKL